MSTGKAGLLAARRIRTRRLRCCSRAMRSGRTPMHSCCGWIVATPPPPREATRLGLERRASAFAEQRTGASDRARGMETGIYGATLQWARIGVIMVVCSWHDALGADQLPREIVGNWCLAIERMLPETYAYRRCKDSRYTSSCARTASTRRRPVAKSTRSGVKARPGWRAFAARVLG